MAFIFDASKETPAGLARKRAVAEALAGPTPAPRNVGDGLAALGEAIGYRMTLGDIARGEAVGDAPPPVRAGAAGSTARGSDMNGPAAGTPAVQRVAQALNPGAYRGMAIDVPGHAPAAPAMPSPVSAIPASPVRAAASPPADAGAAPPGAFPTQAPYPTPRPAMMPDADAKVGPLGEVPNGTGADPLSMLGRELDRYEKLVRGTGIEAMPGQGKDSLNAVRQGIMLRTK